MHWECPDWQGDGWVLTVDSCCCPPAPSHSLLRPGFQTADEMFTSAITHVIAQTFWQHCEWCCASIAYHSCHKKAAGQRGIVEFHPQGDSSLRMAKAGQCLPMGSNVEADRSHGVTSSCRLSMKADFNSSLPLGQRGSVFSFWDPAEQFPNKSHSFCGQLEKNVKETDSCWDYICVEQSKGKSQVNLSVD